MIDGISALNATQLSTSALGAPTAPGSSVSAAGGTDFGQIMNEVAGDAVGNLKSAEAASIGSMQGTAPVHQVVESIMSAQRSLQSVLAMRDKAVSAYQEISRMAM